MLTLRFCRRASDKCLKEKRKTINGDDLLCAMSTLGFEDYVEPLKLYLQKFREAEVSKLHGDGAMSGGPPVDMSGQKSWVSYPRVRPFGVC